MNNLMKFKFTRPGGINILNRQIDTSAQKQLYSFVQYLNGIKLPSLQKAQIDNMDLEPQDLISKFFTHNDPDLDSLNDLKKELLELDADTYKCKNISDFIDVLGYASLFYEVEKMISDDTLSLNAYSILRNDTIASYLFARAVFSPELQLKDAVAIYKNMRDEDGKKGGAKLVYDFVVYNASIQIKKENKVEIGAERHNVMASRIVSGPKLSFAEGVFATKILQSLKQHVFSRNELKLILEHKDKLNISDEDIPYLVSYIKKSKIEIDDDNATVYLAIALSNLKNNNLSNSSQDQDDGIEELDFSVKYYEDVKTAQSFNKESVLCAAQLYYVMVLGDELGIFEVINNITGNEMLNGRVDIASKQLMKDLETYRFNEKFFVGNNPEPKNRTVPEERHMFYKQVFDLGDGQLINSATANKEFNIIMNSLFEEVVKYIDKVERSNSSSTMISRQNLYQAIEDLQYNLSSYCTGMVKVAAPLINNELDFVIERFLMNDDIRKQLAPNGNGSIWKVIENVQRVKGQNSTTLLRNKAIFTHKILTAVANYTPIYFEEENVINDFVSTVEALIINNSQLEESQKFNNQNGPELKSHDWDNSNNEFADNDLLDVNGSAMKDEWNF